MQPMLFTFDIFGTVVDSQRGLREALHHRTLTDDEFERIAGMQRKLQSGPFQAFTDVVAQSLVEVLRVEPAAARSIGETVGPLYPDAREGIARLMQSTPCVAMANADRAHRGPVEAQLGFPFSDWVCAEDTQVYKPASDFWHFVARKRGQRFDKSWWHVSAYADRDLDMVRSLGLTAVFLRRPHHVHGPADYEFRSFTELADFLPVPR